MVEIKVPSKIFLPVQDSSMARLNVLFMQSQSYYGADSLIHGLLMEHFDRSRLNIHVACNQGNTEEPSASLKNLSKISGLNIQPTHFGVSVNSRSRSEIGRKILSDGPPSMASLGKLVQYTRRNNIQIIHATEKPRDAFYGLILARLTGAHCLIHMHVKIEDWISPLTLWAMRHAEALLGVSRFVSESAVAFGFPPHKIYHVLNGLDASGWDSQLNGNYIRTEFGIGEHDPTLAVISRLFPWKGHTELLAALAHVKHTMPNVKLLVVGEDDPRATPGGGSYLMNLKEMATALCITDNVIFTGYRRDVDHILAAADLFAMPTFEEPFGMVFLEAMAMKKPIIAIESGGVPEIVEHGKTGLLSPYKDIDQLARNIVTLLDDPYRCRLMGEAGRIRLEEYFTPTRMANEVEQVYRQILAA